VETVAAIGEVKSILSKSDFLESLVKLSIAKQLRNVEGKSVVRRATGILGSEVGQHHFDHLVSFIICEKLSFKLDNITAEVSKHYEESGILPQHRHNLILSLEDGILCYKNHLLERKNVAWMYPTVWSEAMKSRFIFPGNNGRNHFGFFTAYLFLLCANATIYLPHLSDYDTPPSEGIYQDEK
jgi:hypothetical protein